MSTDNSSSSALPPEAIALAGRLFEAARKGDESSTALLEAALNRGGAGLARLRNDKGDTLIMLAAYHGHPNLVKLLLRHGADPNIINDRGQSTLAGVVFKNERECILALLEGDADPEIGQPNAIECCKVFKQEEYLNMFLEQIERLNANGSRAVNGNSNGNGNGNGNDDSHGVARSSLNGDS